jgi:hypothetical protein
MTQNDPFWTLIGVLLGPLFETSSRQGLKTNLKVALCEKTLKKGSQNDPKMPQNDPFRPFWGSFGTPFGGAILKVLLIIGHF